MAKVNIEEQIEPMAYAQIELKRPINNQYIYKTNVYEAEGNKIYIYPPKADDQSLKFSRVDESFTVIIYTKKYLLKYQCNYIKEHKDNGVTLHIVEATGQPKKIQRRDFYRIQRVIPLTYQILEHGILDYEDEIENDIEIEEVTDERFQAATKDLSASGMRFNTLKDMTKESIVHIEIDLGTGKIPMKGIVIDKTENQRTHEYPYQYRIHLTEISEKDRDKIIDYVWQEQQIKQEKRPLK